MKRPFIYILFYCFSMSMSVCAMSPLDAEISHSRVLTGKKIAFNTLKYSYLSRPTASELSKAGDVLAQIPEDLLAEVTFTHKKIISLAAVSLDKNISNLVECSDPTKIVMSSSCGSVIGLDLVAGAIYRRILSFDNPCHINVNFDEISNKNIYLEGFSSQDDSNNDFAFSNNDDESTSEDWLTSRCGIECIDVESGSFLDIGKYVGITLSPDGNVWGAVSPEHNDRLLIGHVEDIFDTKKNGENVAIAHQINLADELAVHYGTLNDVVFSSDGLECVAIWEPLSSRFNDTHKMLFGQNTGNIKETSEMPKINMLAYAHNEPLLAASHEDGIVSFWNMKEGEPFDQVKFFEPDELITAIDFSHDNKILYIANVVGELCAFNRTNKQNIQRYASDDGAIVKIIRSHPQGLCVATATYNGDVGRVILWNKDVTKKLVELDAHVTALNFSHDGSFLYFVTHDKQLQRIPLGNPWELVCLRAWIACKDKPDLEELFKDWLTYKKVLEAGGICEDVYKETFKKNRGIYKEFYRKLFINCSIYKKVMSQEKEEHGLLGESLRNYLKQSTN